MCNLRSHLVRPVSFCPRSRLRPDSDAAFSPQALGPTVPISARVRRSAAVERNSDGSSDNNCSLRSLPSTRQFQRAASLICKAQRPLLVCAGCLSRFAISHAWLFCHAPANLGSDELSGRLERLSSVGAVLVEAHRSCPFECLLCVHSSALHRRSPVNSRHSLCGSRLCCYRLCVWARSDWSRLRGCGCS